ncbi:MAG: hypothetical protein WCX29_04050 [Candidatus Peribacteraceae bacterium]|nr:hypothetical protein [Candidatus Peribacteria bacterium]
MKSHIFIACLIGFLAVGYTLVAPWAPPIPDSMESIAQGGRGLLAFV